MKTTKPNWYIVGARHGRTGIFGPATAEQCEDATTAIQRHTMGTGTMVYGDLLTADQRSYAEPIGQAFR